MGFASEIVKSLFGKELSAGYALLFLSFVIFCVSFVIWAIYYATVKKGVSELSSITWLSLKDTLKYTGITVMSIVIASGVLFVYDFVLDKILNVIVKNAK
jgi:preprotein translocase SecE subunit